ncbi:sigma-70 family RNA polymerase sigma factor, partial [Myxococcota bacterium]|nr:sigma-70 family RNA polymerase sigma factor [Myxococcota bacterium]MBU1534370.1 sigma-70 family RNA polymerase sigma factor [Myxococcota bacterium]
MARYSTLTSEDEISLGRSIREIRVSLWTHLLQFDFARHTLMEEIQNIETDIPDSLISFISQKTLTPKKNKRNSDSSQENPLDAAARELNKIDLDEIALGKILDMVSRQFSGSQGVKLRKSKKTFAFFHEIEQLLKELKHVKHQFINANLRLVIAVARRYNNGPMTLIDLIQEGNIGLMKAVDRFDPDRGYRFSTYAAWWIRHAVSRASADKGRTVRL